MHHFQTILRLLYFTIGISSASDPCNLKQIQLKQTETMIEQLTSAEASSKVEGKTFRRETPFWKPNVKLNVLLTTLDALPQPLLII